MIDDEREKNNFTNAKIEFFYFTKSDTKNEGNPGKRTIHVTNGKIPRNKSVINNEVPKQEEERKNKKTNLTRISS